MSELFLALIGLGLGLLAWCFINGFIDATTDWADT